MEVSLIAAATLNNVIGKEGGMPWHMPEDLKYFKRTTLHHFVIMGRKTFFEFGIGKPLPKRTNVVVTRQPDLEIEGALVAHSLESALTLARKAGETEAFVIGGEQIYRLALPLADRIYLTRIHATLEGDTYFPEFDENEWQLGKLEPHCADGENPYDYDFTVWERQ